MVDRSSITCSIDLGGTSIRVGLFDSKLRPIESRSMPTCAENGPQDAVQRMAAVLRALLHDHAPWAQERLARRRSVH